MMGGLWFFITWLLLALGGTLAHANGRYVPIFGVEPGGVPQSSSSTSSQRNTTNVYGFELLPQKHLWDQYREGADTGATGAEKVQLLNGSGPDDDWKRDYDDWRRDHERRHKDDDDWRRDHDRKHTELEKWQRDQEDEHKHHKRDNVNVRSISIVAVTFGSIAIVFILAYVIWLFVRCMTAATAFQREQYAKQFHQHQQTPSPPPASSMYSAGSRPAGAFH